MQKSCFVNLITSLYARISTSFASFKPIYCQLPMLLHLFLYIINNPFPLYTIHLLLIFTFLLNHSPHLSLHIPNLLCSFIFSFMLYIPRFFFFISLLTDSTSFTLYTLHLLLIFTSLPYPTPSFPLHYKHLDSSFSYHSSLTPHLSLSIHFTSSLYLPFWLTSSLPSRAPHIFNFLSKHILILFHTK